MANVNLFSIQANEYSKFRPKYPDNLFKLLNTLIKNHTRAWDCATGNGQSARGLVPYFDEIFASDISFEQLSHAFKHPKIKYFQAPAEYSKIETSSVDLITIATAIHWFDKPKFFKEAKRILKLDGVLAFWNYTYTFISKDIDKLMLHYVNEILGEKYWEKEALDVFRNEYNFKIPFKELKIPKIDMVSKWDLEEYVKYLITWSSAQAYMIKNNSSPIDLIYKDLKYYWGDVKKKRTIRWNLIIKVLKIN